MSMVQSHIAKYINNMATNMIINKQRRAFAEKMQRDVDLILSEIKQFIHDEEEGSDGLHFDVDFVLEQMHSISHRKMVKKEKQITQKVELTHTSSPRIYKSEVYDSPLIDRSRKSLGRLNQAARFLFT